MEKNNSQNVDQKIKSTVVGTGNTTIIAQVIVNTNSPDIDTNAIQNTLINEIRSSLKEEFVSTEYNILLCYPNKLIRDEPTLKIIKEIKQKLDKMGAKVYEGGGKTALPKTQITYPHLAELEFIKTVKCDTVIIFALDEVTLSQLTLISYFKVSKKIDSTDMIIISSDTLKNSDIFLSNGTFQYCDDNNCKLYSLNSLDDAGLKSVIARIENKKIIQRKGGLLGD
ncbi:hypothetical protein ABFE35_004754 [Salmonella enterica]|uniref:hypothetical protein n=1 Tax=Citrobacter sp. KTE30 TaxID=1169319 RepID=UPI0010BCC49C|nr:hypothetical protein [Citrobacter sp. KTE30]EAA3458562.1 hypothetical protein [Salmonella enterica subsp. enterica serovar Miami]EDR6494482.1 hypothetical protein [Salmonella enterica subsp. diarizonae]EJO9637576.1 hypothetical protein [Salmonella enterica]EBY0390133.1 hypothetical protein [Salmonella enterica subsp. enterica serovar Miami]EJP1134635.1 hypothetical protein [Salmonella enterica]